jgi:sugar transferase (PEP-CTERM/EpsH1 system associated)
MRILFLAHRIPYPPNKGEKIRAYHELKFLGTRHTVDLLCFADSVQEQQEQKELQALCRNIYVERRLANRIARGGLRSLLRGEPLSCGSFFSPKFQQEVRRMFTSNAYDVILVFCSSMAQYVSWPPPAPVVMDFVDVDSAKWAEYARRSHPPRSWLYAREARTLARHEKYWAATNYATVVSTQREAALLAVTGLSSVVVVGNGVEIRPRIRTLPEEVKTFDPYVVFIGTMNYLPNIDAAEHFAADILPRIHKTHSELKFVIVGRDPAVRVRRLARLPGVVVTGTVPEVETYLAGSIAVVAPFRMAHGIQNKMLEALAFGKPIVSTSGPARAIGAADGETLTIADNADEFARAVVALLEDSRLYNRLSQGTDFVRRNFDWQDKLGQLEELLLQAAGLEPSSDGVVMNRAQAN